VSDGWFIPSAAKRRQACYKLWTQYTAHHHSHAPEQHGTGRKVRGAARVRHFLDGGVGHDAVWVVHGRFGRVLVAGGRGAVRTNLARDAVVIADL
jgi:hypothetical protein